MHIKVILPFRKFWAVDNICGRVYEEVALVKK